MLTKIMMGVSAAAVIALLVVFKLLLSSNEARGALAAEVRNAGAVNDRQALVVDTLQKHSIQAAADLKAEKARSDAATEALIVSQGGLVTAKTEFEDRLEIARLELDDAELVCAIEPVPASYIDSLRE